MVLRFADRGVEAGVEADVVAVDEDVEEGRQRAVVEDAPLERGVGGDELVERLAHRSAPDLDEPDAAGFVAEDGRDLQRRHELSLADFPF